jgi:hypothetical protein
MGEVTWFRVVNGKTAITATIVIILARRHNRSCWRIWYVEANLGRSVCNN